MAFNLCEAGKFEKFCITQPLQIRWRANVHRGFFKPKCFALDLGTSAGESSHADVTKVFGFDVNRTSSGKAEEDRAELHVLPARVCDGPPDFFLYFKVKGSVLGLYLVYEAGSEVGPVFAC